MSDTLKQVELLAEEIVAATRTSGSDYGMPHVAEMARQIIRLVALPAPDPLRIGDMVTAPSWGGFAAVITEFVEGPERVAKFDRGGFWRVSQLQRVEGRP